MATKSVSRKSLFWLEMLIPKLSGVKMETYEVYIKHEALIQQLVGEGANSYRNLNSFWRCLSGQEVALFPIIFIGENQEASNCLQKKKKKKKTKKTPLLNSHPEHSVQLS